MSIKFIFCIVALIFLSACDESTSELPETRPTTSQTGATKIECNSKQNSGIDCGCISNLIENSWSDDPEMDASAIFSKPENELSQQSIDVIIGIALMANDECVTGQKRTDD